MIINLIKLLCTRNKEFHEQAPWNNLLWLYDHVFIHFVCFIVQYVFCSRSRVRCVCSIQAEFIHLKRQCLQMKVFSDMFLCFCSICHRQCWPFVSNLAYIEVNLIFVCLGFSKEMLIIHNAPVDLLRDLFNLIRPVFLPFSPGVVTLEHYLIPGTIINAEKAQA